MSLIKGRHLPSHTAYAIFILCIYAIFMFTFPLKILSCSSLQDEENEIVSLYLSPNQNFPLKLKIKILQNYAQYIKH